MRIGILTMGILWTECFDLEVGNLLKDVSHKTLEDYEFYYMDGRMFRIRVKNRKVA